MSPKGVVTEEEGVVGEGVPSSSHTLTIVEQLGFPSCVGTERREGERKGGTEGRDGERGTEGRTEGGWGFHDI